ncbi:collagen, type I, alpha 1a-like [Elgaria multicarinata webbii]|uniref:collagen, type I, alpha 1a-like n=1 Tax=Elgaria multicarinata webbii TaxID=159646 RepID=UPI002FCD5587
MARRGTRDGYRRSQGALGALPDSEPGVAAFRNIPFSRNPNALDQPQDGSPAGLRRWLAAARALHPGTPGGERRSPPGSDSARSLRPSVLFPREGSRRPQATGRRCHRPQPLAGDPAQKANLHPPPATRRKACCCWRPPPGGLFPLPPRGQEMLLRPRGFPDPGQMDDAGRGWGSSPGRFAPPPPRAGAQGSLSSPTVVVPRGGRRPSPSLWAAGRATPAWGSQGAPRTDQEAPPRRGEERSGTPGRAGGRAFPGRRRLFLPRPPAPAGAPDVPRGGTCLPPPPAHLARAQRLPSDEPLRPAAPRRPACGLAEAAAAAARSGRRGAPGPSQPLAPGRQRQQQQQRSPPERRAAVTPCRGALAGSRPLLLPRRQRQRQPPRQSDWGEAG